METEIIMKKIRTKTIEEISKERTWSLQSLSQRSLTKRGTTINSLLLIKISLLLIQSGQFHQPRRKPPRNRTLDLKLNKLNRTSLRLTGMSRQVSFYYISSNFSFSEIALVRIQLKKANSKKIISEFIH
jgi:hypothetical protein